MKRRALVCLMASVALAQGCSVGHPTFFITGCPEVGTTVAVGETVTFMVGPLGEIVFTVGIGSGDAEVALLADGTIEVVPSSAGTIVVVFAGMFEDLRAQDECTFEVSAE